MWISFHTKTLKILQKTLANKQWNGKKYWFRSFSL